MFEVISPNMTHLYLLSQKYFSTMLFGVYVATLMTFIMEGSRTELKILQVINYIKGPLFDSVLHY